MHRKGFINELFDEEAFKQAEQSRTKNINKFIECFNLNSTHNKTRQIRILQIGNAGIATIPKKPFLTTQPIKKQTVGLFNNEILTPGAMQKDFMFIEASKTGYYMQSGSGNRNHSKTISPEKQIFFSATQYVAINSSPKKTRGWMTRKKKVEQLPKQFYRKSSQNAAIVDVQQIQVDENVSRSVNLLNKVKLAEQYNLVALQNKSGAIIQHKVKSKIEQVRKTPQQIAQQQRRNKLQIKRQISQDYAKPFNPPVGITAASYIIFEPKFSANSNGRKRKYYPNPEIGNINMNMNMNMNQAMEKSKKKYPHSHKVIASFNSRNAVEVASLTKIMTCILGIQICQRFKLDPKQQKILIGKFESNIGGTSAQISEGQTYTLQDLFYGLMLPSGNDASVAIAVWGGRTLLSHQLDILTTHKKKQFYQRFIQQMNKKCKQLGMHKTNYANSHGLCNPQNKSCAFDLAILCQHAMENNKFKQIVSTKNYKNTIQYDPEGCNLNVVSKKGSMKDIRDKGDDQIQEGEEKDLDSNQEENQDYHQAKNTAFKTVEWENTHRLVQQKSTQYIGIKTGITTAAGPCLASCIKTSSERFFIIIVLNCDRLSMRFKDTENLKKWVYQRQGMVSPRKKPEKESGLSPRQQPISPNIFAND